MFHRLARINAKDVPASRLPWIRPSAAGRVRLETAQEMVLNGSGDRVTWSGSAWTLQHRSPGVADISRSRSNWTNPGARPPG